MVCTIQHVRRALAYGYCSLLDWLVTEVWECCSRQQSLSAEEFSCLPTATVDEGLGMDRVRVSQYIMRQS